MNVSGHGSMSPTLSPQDELYAKQRLELRLNWITSLQKNQIQDPDLRVVYPYLL